MSETETNQESVNKTSETKPGSIASTTLAKKKPVKAYVIAVLIVLVIILGVLYKLEKEGRSSTTIFSSIIESQQANVVVATVNEEEIINSELELSIEQFSQAAAFQGIDPSSPEAQADIREQALDVLVNTTLLRQAATGQGLSVSEEEVETRLEEIRTELGGAEVLDERMAELGIDEERLYRDIGDELLIQMLLDSIFADSEITVSDEEVQEMYDAAGGEEAGLPALEEVRSQIESQIIATKEQAAIEEYLNRLKEEATIERS